MPDEPLTAFVETQVLVETTPSWTPGSDESSPLYVNLHLSDDHVAIPSLWSTLLVYDGRGGSMEKKSATPEENTKDPFPNLHCGKHMLPYQKRNVQCLEDSLPVLHQNISHQTHDVAPTAASWSINQ